ncbi:MAG TPA: response regulator transcription factor [Vicinamibacteria bacterium]|nr:response regulator transcription factor [Vicinamibacteria bacterium]
MGGEKILVVEDEQAIQQLLHYNLRKAGYETVSALSGREALERVDSETPALILLDLMLPDIDGLSLCRKLRTRQDTRSVPIVMLTARGEESDIIRGLEMGADDYVTKPFTLPVLIARIGAVLRRGDDGQSDGDEPLRIGEVSLHPGRREVRVSEKTVTLTNTEFRVLLVLMRRPGWVFTRQQIVDAVRSERYAVTERSVDVQIVGLRKKLGSASRQIETVRGVGYRFRD